MKTRGTSFEGQSGAIEPSGPEGTGKPGTPAGPRPSGAPPPGAPGPLDGLDRTPFSSGAFERYETVGRKGAEGHEGGELFTADTVRDHFALQDLRDHAGPVHPDARQTMLKEAERKPALCEPFKRLAGNPGFQALDRSAQTIAFQQVAAHASDPMSRDLLIRSFRELANTPGFQALPPAAQARAFETLGRTWSDAPGQRAGITSLGRATSDPDFVALSAGNKTLAVEQLGRHTGASGAERAALDSLSSLVTAPGFAQLSEADQSRLLRYVGGKNDFLSNPGRAALDTLLKRPDFVADTPASQAAKLKTFLDNQTGTPFLVPPGGGAPTPAASTLSPGREVAQFAFASGSADAVTHTVTIDGQAIQVTVPRNPPGGPALHTVAEVRQALANLPANVRAQIKEVRVNPGANPDDAHWQAAYNNPNHVSYMTASSAGVVDIYPAGGKASQQVMETSMVHETGHIISGRVWGDDTNDPRWGTYKAAMAKDNVVASGYGRSSPADDFAEGWALYNTVKGKPQEAELRALMPERWKLFDQLSAPAR